MKKLMGLIVLGIVFFIGGQWLGLSISQGNRVSSGNSEAPTPEAPETSAQNGSASPAVIPVVQSGTSLAPNAPKTKPTEGKPAVDPSLTAPSRPPLKAGPAKIVPPMKSPTASVVNPAVNPKKQMDKSSQDLDAGTPSTEPPAE